MFRVLADGEDLQRSARWNSNQQSVKGAPIGFPEWISSPPASLCVPLLLTVLIGWCLWTGAFQPVAAQSPEPVVVAAVFARTGHGSLQSLPSYDMVQLAAIGPSWSSQAMAMAHRSCKRRASR